MALKLLHDYDTNYYNKINNNALYTTVHAYLIFIHNMFFNSDELYCGVYASALRNYSSSFFCLCIMNFTYAYRKVLTRRYVVYLLYVMQYRAIHFVVYTYRLIHTILVIIL